MLAAHSIYRGFLALMLVSTVAGAAHGQGFGFRVGGQSFQIGGNSGFRPAVQPQRQVGPSMSIGNFGVPSNFGRAAESIVPRIAEESIRQLTGQPRYEDRRYRPNPGGRLDLSQFRFEHAAALAIAVAAGGQASECKNPFCETRPITCPPVEQLEYTPEQYFEQAQLAFRYQQYDRALNLTDRALALLPNEPDLFQFRSLILFAQGDHVSSAAAAYTALSLGPGWNWDTLYGFYGDAGLYTRHLRGLEAATKANPDSAEHHFLHGYHCLMLGHLEQGRQRLQRVLEIQPDEGLTQSLLEMLPAEG